MFMVVLTALHNLQTTAGQFSQVGGLVLVAIYLVVNVLVIEQTEQRQLNFLGVTMLICNLDCVNDIAII